MNGHGRGAGDKRSLFLNAVAGACSRPLQSPVRCEGEAADPPLPEWTALYLREFDSFLRGDQDAALRVVA